MNAVAGQRRTLAGRLIDELTYAIVTGAIPPGSKINEPDLASRYAVSRGPLREAVRGLEGRGLVRHVPRAGARVVTLDFDEVTELDVIREATTPTRGP